MTNWRTRGKRGDLLEELIIKSNEYYHKAGVARIDKAATPVKVVEIDGKGLVTKAFFEKKATVDFYGVAQGIFICFDAKETNLKNFPLKNIHAHQIDYMKDVETQGGLSFLIVYFKDSEEFFILPFEIIYHYYQNSLKGGRKSIPYDQFPKELQIKPISSGVLHYLETVNNYIEWKKSIN